MECVLLNSCCDTKNSNSCCDDYFATITIEQAKIAQKNNEVPVGAVVVIDNKIITTGYNKCEENCDSLYHAEIVAINKASKLLKTKNFSNATLYTSLEPCLMCLGYIHLMKFNKVIYLASDKKYGVCGGWQDLSLLKPFGNSVNIIQHNNQKLIEESSKMLSAFFSEIREK